jgi:hypothetical protein
MPVPFLLNSSQLTCVYSDENYMALKQAALDLVFV